MTTEAATAISARLPEVTIEFDGPKGTRLKKHFQKAIEGRKFYAAKEKANKNPAVVPTEQAAEAPAKPAKAKKGKTGTVRIVFPRDAKKPAEPAPDAAPAKQAAEKPARKPKPAADKPATVRPRSVNTVQHFVGQAIAERGLDAAVDQALVDRVAKLTGRRNDHQDWFNCRNAVNAIKGYLATLNK